MIASISSSIVNKMIVQGRLQPSQAEECVYNLTCKIEKRIFIISALILGLALGEIISTALLLCVMLTIKKYTGGFHAKTFAMCLLLSLSIIAAGALCVTYLGALPIWILLVDAAISSLIIFLLSPINHPNFCGTKEELAFLRRKGRQYTLLFLTLAIACCLSPVPTFIPATIVFGLQAIAILLILAKLAGQDIHAL